MSKYIVALLPSSNFSSKEPHSFENNDFWNKCLSISHPNVIFFKNYEIYKLSSPYESQFRKMIKLNISDLQLWFKNRGEKLDNFNLKNRNLLISTSNCVPYQYWTNFKDDSNKKVHPSTGDTAVMCNSDGKNLVEPDKFCCKITLFKY